MPSKTPFSKTPFPIPAAGAVAALCGGLASAIMIAAAGKHLAFDGKLHLEPQMQSQQLLPTMLVFLSPLPLMVTTVGFGTIAGAVAVLVGATAFGALAPLLAGAAATDPQALSRMALRGLAFAITFGCPALLLGGLTRRPLPKRGIDPPSRLRKGRPEERLIGGVIAAAIAVSAVVVAVWSVLLIQYKGGGYHAVFQDLTQQLQTVLAADPNGKKVDPAWIARVLIWLVGLTISSECVCLFALNLWLAGRIAQTSGLLAQPWPSLSRYLRVPSPLAILAAVAFGLSFAGGLVGLVAVIVAGATTAGFAFQGLAVVHELTRDASWRTPVLFGIYLALSILHPLLLIFAVLGLCDAAFFFRDREKSAADKKPDDQGPHDRGPWS